MSKIILLLAASFLFFLTPSFASATGCAVDAGSGDADENGVANEELPNIAFEIKFKGPENKFWKYVNDDPDTWMFEIVPAKMTNKTIPKFKTVLFSLPGGKEAEFSQSDIIFKSKTVFTIKREKVLEFINDSKKAIAKMREEKKGVGIPKAGNQMVGFTFIFPTTNNYEEREDWLYQSCALGFGINSLGATFFDKDGKSPLKALKVEIEVNNPDLEGTDIKSKFDIITSSQGDFLIKGLPMGTFFVNAGKFGDREIAGAFFKNGPQLCTFKIKRETLKPEVTYSIMESNSCKGSNPVIRKSPSQSQTK